MNPKLQCAALAALFAVISFPAAGAEVKGPFEVKSGIVETTTELVGTTTEVLYFDDYGRKQAKYTTSTVQIGDMKNTSHKLELTFANGTSYQIDLDEKTGTKMTIPPEMAQLAGAAMSEEMKKQLDLKTTDLADKEFLGKKCKGLQVEAKGMPTTRTWTWKGLPLYTEAGTGQGKPMVIRATKLQVDVSIPGEKFKVPKDIQIQDLQGQN